MRFMVGFLSDEPAALWGAAGCGLLPPFAALGTSGGLQAEQLAGSPPDRFRDAGDLLSIRFQRRQLFLRHLFLCTGLISRSFSVLMSD